MDREVVSLLNYLLKRWQPPVYQQALSEISFPFYLIKKNSTDRNSSAVAYLCWSSAHATVYV